MRGLARGEGRWREVASRVCGEALLAIPMIGNRFQLLPDHDDGKQPAAPSPVCADLRYAPRKNLVFAIPTVFVIDLSWMEVLDLPN